MVDRLCSTRYNIFAKINKGVSTMRLYRFILYKKVNIVLTVLVCLIVLGFVIFGLFVLKAKTPVTSKEMWEVLISLGYEPEDTTSLYLEGNANADGNLIKCISTQKEDVYFQFLDFYNKDSAFLVYRNTRNALWDKKDITYAENDTSYHNFYFYSLTSGGKYYVIIWVDNTAVYATSDEENISLIGNILSDIEYTP